MYFRPKSSANDRSIIQHSNPVEQRLADHRSMHSASQQIASFHKKANRAETREYETGKIDFKISSEKIAIDTVMYSKLSVRY